MSGGPIWKKPDVGFGAGVRPTAGLMNNPDYLISQGRGIRANSGVATTTGAMQSIQNKNFGGGSGPHPGWESGYSIREFTGVPPNGDIWDWSGASNSGIRGDFRRGSTSNPYSAADISEEQGRYDRAEERRQEKLDAMAELAQGKGGSGGGVRGQIVGDGGDLNIQHTPMERGKDGFPTLADFEQPLHPFLGKRRRRYS